MLFSTRPAGPDDRKFLFEGYKTCLKEYIDQTWGWDEHFQQTEFSKNLPLERFQIIVADGCEIGAAHIVETEEHYRVELIFILPRFQRQGIGTRVLQDVMSAARDSGKGVTLAVMKVNPARSLYERLGFQVVAEVHGCFEMKWRVPPAC
jgi:GNAT superfamily N-acetyltransferase